MGTDDGNGTDDGFWVTQVGCDARHSDGTGGEEAMLFTMLHHFGWIDVEIHPAHAIIRLNPATVCPEALETLRPALEERAPNRRIDLVLFDPDANPVDISYPTIAQACQRLEAVTADRPNGGSDDDDLDSAWGDEAFPLPQPQRLVENSRSPLVLPSALDADEPAFVSEERFAQTLTSAEWLAPINTADSLRDRRLVEQTPEMASFALRSLGWIAIKRNWNLHRQSLRLTPPDVVALDPTGVRREALNQLIALSGVWAGHFGEMTFAWWNGTGWQRGRGSPLEMADKVRALCRVPVNDEPMSLVDSVEVPIGRLFSSGSAWSENHPFAMTLKRWQDEQANAGASDAILRDLERMGLFQKRTKLLVVDENEEMRIARYAPGTVQVWDDRAHRAMEGSRLVDVPDRGLGLSVQRDLLSVHRRREPVLHRCSGVVLGSEGLQIVQWSRLTVPLIAEVNGEQRVSALLSTCELELATPI